MGEGAERVNLVAVQVGGTAGTGAGSDRALPPPPPSPAPQFPPLPSLPTPPPALPGEEEVGLVADGGRKLDRVVLRRRFGAVAGWGETWPWGGREDPETPPQPPNLPPRPPHGVQPPPHPSYLPASRATSARSRRMEQLNSNSRVKETWGRAGPSAGWDGCTGGSRGVSRSLTLASEWKTG